MYAIGIVKFCPSRHHVSRRFTVLEFVQGGLRALPTSASSSKKPKVAVLGELFKISLVTAMTATLSKVHSVSRAWGYLGHSRGHVADAGAAGGIGQPLALLLKGSSLVGELSLYDIVGTEGVAADLSHIDSSVKVVLHI